MTAELTVSDGQRHIGRIVPRGDAFEAFDASDNYLCKGETIAEARRTIIKADREREAELNGMADDVGRAA